MIRLLRASTNTFVVDSKGFDKSATYTASFFGKSSKETTEVTLTDISSSGSTWLRFSVVMPDDLDLPTQEYSVEIKREDGKTISKTIAVVYELQSELQSYDNGKKYTQYNPN